jgi:translation initiation factor IF-2
MTKSFSAFILLTSYISAVATVIVSRGCLKPGANLIAGTTSGKVRVMTDSAGKPVKVAYPGDAVSISGWKELPGAGDEVLQASENDIKRALANRLRKAEQEAMLTDVDAINAHRRQERELREAELRAEESGEALVKTPEKEGPKELRLLIKGDVSGSVEALIEALQYIGNEAARVKIIGNGVGEVSESDIMLAKAGEGMYFFKMAVHLLIVITLRQEWSLHFPSLYRGRSRRSLIQTTCPSTRLRLSIK